MGREAPAKEDIGIREVPSDLRPALSRLAHEHPLEMSGKHGGGFSQRDFAKAPTAHLHEETVHGGPFGVAADVGAVRTGQPAACPTST